MSDPLRINYNEKTDILNINGIAYTGEIFRTLAFPNTEHVYSFKMEDGQLWVTDHGTKKELNIK